MTRVYPQYLVLWKQIPLTAQGGVFCLHWSKLLARLIMGFVIGSTVSWKREFQTVLFGNEPKIAVGTVEWLSKRLSQYTCSFCVAAFTSGHLWMVTNDSFEFYGFFRKEEEFLFSAKYITLWMHKALNPENALTTRLQNGVLSGPVGLVLFTAWLLIQWRWYTNTSSMLMFFKVR